MAQALYRKHRPKSFADAIGQEHITQTLEHAVKSGKISHAYLFTGPRGVGKTSVARILAHAVNDLPYKDDTTHMDIIEIDAASNRRIDEIRELRDKVHVTPTRAKYKVYIIDEVHMLTREAFNALLKTLEEPPAHAIFILATTEVHKLPETIISRTQHFAFKPVAKNPAAKHLAAIAKDEKIDITDEALELLAEHGQGSFRDSISMLDQLSTQKGQITEEDVRQTIGLPPEHSIVSLLENITQGEAKTVAQNLSSLINQGVNAATIASSLSRQLRAELINGNTSAWIPSLLRQLLDVPASPYSEQSLEIALLEASMKNSHGTIKPVAAKSEVKKPAAPLIIKEAKLHKTEKTVTKSQKIDKLADSIVETASRKDFDMGLWPQVVQQVKQQNASLYTALRLAKPEYTGGILTLCFQFPLHQKKVNNSQQKEIIGQIIKKLCGDNVAIECAVSKEKFTSVDSGATEKIIPLDPGETADPLKTISNIFGKPEVIES
jgi:DNA polymerase III subunit gamma/tau